MVEIGRRLSQQVYCIAALHAGDLDLAQSLASEILRRHPDWLPSYLQACEVARAQDDKDRADSVMREAIRRFPDDPWPSTYYAYNSLRVGRHDEAAARYFHALSRFPLHIPNLPGLAESIHQAGMPELALAVIEAAARQHPDSPEVSEAELIVARRGRRWDLVPAAATRLLAVKPAGADLVAAILREMINSDAGATVGLVAALLFDRAGVVEAAFHACIDACISRADLPLALRLWRSHADAWPRTVRWHELAADLLRLALIKEIPTEESDPVVIDLLAEPMADSSTWLPRLVVVERVLRGTMHLDAAERLRASVLRLIGPSPRLSPTVAFCCAMLDRQLPYTKTL